MNTITYTEKPNGSFHTIANLNAIFASIKSVLDGKLDRRGDVVEADLKIADGTLINVPRPLLVGDIVGVTDA